MIKVGEVLCSVTTCQKDECKATGACHASLCDELAELRKDAERYRWLRANTGEIVTSAWDCMMFNGGIGSEEDGAALDAAIDAAMATRPVLGAA